MSKIYRFMTLFELHNLLHNNTLKFSRLSTMDDRNEGLGDVLSLMESFEYGFNLKNSKEIEGYHEKIRGKNYISSWTSEPNLIAMWLLYSKNSDSIRVKTSFEKLESVTKEYFDNHFWPQHIDSPEGTLQLDSYPYVKPIKYVSFELLSSEIKEKYKKYSAQCLKVHLGSKSTLKETAKLNADRTVSVLESQFLKDISYSHEQEVRANLSINKRNKVIAEEIRKEWNTEDESIQSVMGTASHSYPPSSELPDIIQVPIPINFIEAVCFDPRTPKYIRNEQEFILRHVCPNIVIEESTVFGYMPNHHDFSFT